MEAPGTLWPAALAGVSHTGLVETQTITWLRADPTLETLIGDRIYTSVPPAAPFPLVTLEATAPGAWRRMRGAGQQITTQLKAQSQVLGSYEVNAIADRIEQLLDGAIATPLGPLRRAEWTIDEGQPGWFREELAGVTTYYRPVIVRVHLTV